MDAAKFCFLSWSVSLIDVFCEYIWGKKNSLCLPFLLKITYLRSFILQPFDLKDLDVMVCFPDTYPREVQNAYVELEHLNSLLLTNLHPQQAVHSSETLSQIYKYE